MRPKKKRVRRASAGCSASPKERAPLIAASAETRKSGTRKIAERASSSTWSAAPGRGQRPRQRLDPARHGDAHRPHEAEEPARDGARRRDAPRGRAGREEEPGHAPCRAEERPAEDEEEAHRSGNHPRRTLHDRSATSVPRT